MKFLRRVVLVTGLVGLTMFSSPFIQDNPIMDFISNTTTITALAAEQPSDLPYSYRWETQADNSWKYKLNSGVYATGWIQDEVDHNWYLHGFQCCNAEWFMCILWKILFII